MNAVLRMMAFLAMTAFLTAPAAAGEAAKPLSLPGLDGSRHSLEEWRGKFVLLNFWASWCGPCLSEIPDLTLIQDQYREKGLKVVGVGLDETRKLRNVARSLEINYTVLVADPEKSARLLQTWGDRAGVIPYTLIIDPQGQVVYRHVGPLDREELEESISRLLTPSQTGNLI